MQKHDIVIIGAGNVAHHLAFQFLKAGHSLLQVVSRTHRSAAELAEELKTDFTNDLNRLNRKASLYIIAVNDDAVKDVAAELSLDNKIVAHTSASVPMDVLISASKNYGVFYPLQTLTKDNPVNFSDIPICIEASNEVVKKELMDLARSISKNVLYLNSEKRKALHVAAIFVNNFANHLFGIGETILKNEKLDFDLLRPLIEETLRKIKNASPNSVQTGPAKRNDLRTIEDHLNYLRDLPEFREIYLVITEGILQANNKATVSPDLN